MWTWNRWLLNVTGSWGRTWHLSALKPLFNRFVKSLLVGFDLTCSQIPQPHTTETLIYGCFNLPPARIEGFLKDRGIHHLDFACCKDRYVVEHFISQKYISLCQPLCQAFQDMTCFDCQDRHSLHLQEYLDGVAPLAYCYFCVMCRLVCPT